MTTENTQDNKLLSDSTLFAVDPSEILFAIRRRLWLIILSAALVGAAVAAGTMRQPKVYAAVARVLLDPVLPKVLGSDIDVDDMAEHARRERVFTNTQYSIMVSRSVFRNVIQRLKLDEDAGLLADYDIRLPAGEARTKAVEELLAVQIKVEPEFQSRIVKLLVEDFDPNRAARIANGVAQAYIDQTLEGRIATTRNASKWLDERVDEFGTRLEESERALYEFHKRNMLVSVSLEDRKNMTTATLMKINDDLLETRSALLKLKAERDVLASLRTNADLDLESLPRVAKNPIIVELKTSIAELRRKRAELSSHYGVRHPNMVSVQKQLDEANESLQREIGLALGTLDNEIAQLAGTEKGLHGGMLAQKNKAMDLNNLALEYAKLNRDVGTNEQTYRSLLKRQTETDLAGRLKSNFVRWLETAEPMPAPIRPSVPMNTALGLVLGLVLGLAIAVGGVLLDSTVHTQADIEERLRLPFLGVVPSIPLDAIAPVEGKPVSNAGRDLFIFRNPKSSVAECARSVRTNLLFMGTEKPLKRLLLTSAGPAEGKSTTVVGLGTTMAQAGNKVLIVDTDLRKPRLHKTFGVSGEEGLTSVMLGTATLDQAIKKSEVVGLDILPCGPHPPNPSELLHSDLFKNLLPSLDERYDQILFDSPPVNAVTDAAILSQGTDGTIIVVKASKTDKAAVRRASRQLMDVNANILGVVLNDVDFEDGGYYRHHYYYYYYYRNKYAYGASDADKNGAGAGA